MVSRLNDVGIKSCWSGVGRGLNFTPIIFIDVVSMMILQFGPQKIIFKGYRWLALYI